MKKRKPLRWEGLTRFLHDGHLVEIERPPCPKCHGPMTLTGVVSRPGGLDVRTFECALCNCTEKVTLEIRST
jgi:hypothetical protein